MQRHETNPPATPLALTLTLTLALPLALPLACTPKPNPKPQTPQSCGEEINIHGKGRNQNARNCIEKAFEEQRPETLAITLHTIEGDPIRYEITTPKEGSQVHLKIESKDRFGSPGTTKTTCQSLHQPPQKQGPPHLTLEACEGQPHPLIIP